MASPRPEDEKLSVAANLAYGFQHVLTMYGGIVAVPLIIGQAAGLSASEIGLLITASLCRRRCNCSTNHRHSIFWLSASVGAGRVLCRCCHNGCHRNLCRNWRGGHSGRAWCCDSGLIDWLSDHADFLTRDAFFPPLVTGIVITTIGLTLMPVAARWAMGGNSKAPDFGSMGNIGLAGLTLLIVLLLSKIGNATISRLSILLAMVIGTGVAWALGMTNFRVWQKARSLPCPKFSIWLADL